MKPYFYITIAIIFTMVVTHSAHSAICFNTGNYNGTNDSTIIIQLENNWAKALMNKDETLFRKYITSDFIYTENDKLYSSEEVLQSLLNTADVVENAYNEDM